MAAPFRVNSFTIFDKSFSSFDLSMTGTPSTTRMWLKPSSRRTLYLKETFRMMSYMLWTHKHALFLDIREIDALIDFI